MNLLALKIGVTGSELCVTNSKYIFALDLNIIFPILRHTLCLDKGNTYAPGSVAKSSHLLLHSFCKYPQYFLFNPKFTLCWWIRLIMSQLNIFMLHFSSHNTAFTYKSWLQTMVTQNTVANKYQYFSLQASCASPSSCFQRTANQKKVGF